MNFVRFFHFTGIWARYTRSLASLVLVNVARFARDCYGVRFRPIFSLKKMEKKCNSYSIHNFFNRSKSHPITVASEASKLQAARDRSKSHPITVASEASHIYKYERSEWSGPRDSNPGEARKSNEIHTKKMSRAQRALINSCFPCHMFRKKRITMARFARSWPSSISYTERIASCERSEPWLCVSCGTYGSNQTYILPKKF